MEILTIQKPKVRDLNIVVKEVLKSTQFEIGKPNPVVGTTPKRNTFQSCRIFSALEFLTNFMSDKSDNWADEYHRRPLVQQQRHRPNGFKIQVTKC